jgi:geranylgeranyl pyrophosphate synthase
MADVSKSAKSKEDILRLYTYKTARYTFALPLIAGAMLAGATEGTIQSLSSFGENIGILFQIQDDKLDSDTNPFTDKDIEMYRYKALSSLDKMNISEINKKVLRELVDFVLTRKK